MQTVTVGHKVACTIVYLDQNGNPMRTPVVPDSAPSWTNAPSAPGVDSLVPNGVECDVDALSAGTDTITLSVVVGGQTFAATLALSIADAPQVLSSVQIAAEVA